MKNIQQIIYTSLKHRDKLKKLIEENKHITLLREWESPALSNGEPRYTAEVEVSDGIYLYLLGFNLAFEISNPINP